MEAKILNTCYSPAQLARWRDAIPGRYSCRAYRGAPDTERMTALHYAAQRVCLPGTRIVIRECTDSLFLRVPLVERIHGTTCYACFIADTEQPLSAALTGFCGEAFVLEAFAMGVGTCWVSGTYRRSAVDVPLKEGERVLAITPLGLPEGEQRAPRRRKGLAQICMTNPEGWPRWAHHAAEAVRQAPSAINRQPWQLSYAQRTLRLLGKKPDSLDMGIALLHMAAAVGDLRHHWEWGEQKCLAHLIVEGEE